MMLLVCQLYYIHRVMQIMSWWLFDPHCNRGECTGVDAMICSSLLIILVHQVAIALHYRFYVSAVCT
jgi:hypothetical protein